MSWYGVLADLVVVLHAGYVSFVVLGLLLILWGVLRRWRWVRNFWFRAVHLLAITIVALESVCGIECPLTTLEHHLRTQAGQKPSGGDFIGRWVHELIFVDSSWQWALDLSYYAFAALVLLVFVKAPPRLPVRKA